MRFVDGHEGRHAQFLTAVAAGLDGAGRPGAQRHTRGEIRKCKNTRGRTRAHDVDLRSSERRTRLWHHRRAIFIRTGAMIISGRSFLNALLLDLQSRSAIRGSGVDSHAGINFLENLDPKNAAQTQNCHRGGPKPSHPPGMHEIPRPGVCCCSRV